MKARMKSSTKYGIVYTVEPGIPVGSFQLVTSMSTYELLNRILVVFRGRGTAIIMMISSQKSG